MGDEMAYVPDVECDVFVSYARNDNDALPNTKGWVTSFVHLLRIALKQRLGNADNLTIFFDISSSDGSQELDVLLRAANSAATFVAIASPSYRARDWTTRELEAFLGRSVADLRFLRDPPDPAVKDRISRLFGVESLRLQVGEMHNDALRMARLRPFWQTDDALATVGSEISLDPSGELFKSRINQLATDLAGVLKARRLVAAGAQPDKTVAISIEGNGKAVSEVSEPSIDRHQNGAKNRKSVLLAQVTDDLEFEREQLKSYLEQFGYLVLPEETYPQGGASFRDAYAADVAKADLIVQLLGPLEGRTPRDLGVSYTKFQADVAEALNRPVKRWRRPDLDLDAIQSVTHRRLLESEYTTASGLETFKLELLDLLKTSTSVERISTSALVFINADDEDLSLAKSLQKSFEQYKLATMLPMRSGSATDIRSDLEQNYVECEAVIFLYGKASPSWVRGQLRLFNKMRARREEAPRSVAILVYPPSGKPELGVNYPGAIELILHEETSEQSFQQLATRLLN